MDTEVILPRIPLERRPLLLRGPIDLIASLEIRLTGREEALLQLLLKVTKQLSTRDLVEDFCAFGIWPLT